MQPIIDHIQITVKDITKAEDFYDRFLSIMGFDIAQKTSAVIKEHDLYVVEYLSESFNFAISSPRTVFKDEDVHRRKPGAFHHLAFRAVSRQQVDELYLKIKAIGAEMVYSPRVFPEHGANYYATFFKDLDGIKYEIVYNQPI